MGLIGTRWSRGSVVSGGFSQQHHRWHAYQMERGHNIRNLKRHSDGTFTSDFTHYLDKIKAKDFVEWLASTKREGCHEDLLQTAAEV
ncbi:glucagon-like [Scomber scombrus]|uniref:Glucagon-like n=1 Tax=Scomber scombrus TaxID=13677 RepID=A0AAV1MY16_SCOSC